MTEQQQQQPPSPGEEAAEKFPAKEVVRNIAFLRETMAALEPAPDVRHEFFALLTGFGADAGSGDARAVAARARELLRGHPVLLGRFNAILRGADFPAVPAPEQPCLAAARPRRSSRKKAAERDGGRPVPAAEIKTTNGAGGDGQDNHDTERAERVIRKGRRRDAAARAREDDPGRFAAALAFAERVREVAGPQAFARLVDVLFDAEDDEGMLADTVYDGARDALGPAHGDLLDAFAAFLPAGNWLRMRIGGRSGGGRGRDDDDDDDGNYAPRLRTKKPRIDDDVVGECSGRAAAVGVPLHDDDNDMKPPPRRRARNGGNNGSSAAGAAAGHDSGEFRRFRKAWEFETGYSALTATLARVEELLLLRPGDDGGARCRGRGRGAASPSSLEGLFPRRECREFLANLYGGAWADMRALLVAGERRTARMALEVVQRSLRRKEGEAAEEARRRRDPARAAERLQRLVADRLDAERRWGNERRR